MSAAWEVEVADETASQERVIDKEVQITLVFVQVRPLSLIKQHLNAENYMAHSF